MKNQLKSTVLTIILLLIVSCSSTKVLSSFVDPSAKSDLQNSNKILVAMLIKNDAATRNAENTISQAIGSKAVPAYSLMTDLTKDNVENYLKANNFDIALISRLVSVDKDTEYVSGGFNLSPSYYGGFYGYWGVAYGNYYDPGYYVTTKSYKVETNVYNLKNNKLLYSATTDTYSPSSFNTGMNDIIDAIKDDLQKNGIINK